MQGVKKECIKLACFPPWSVIVLGIYDLYDQMVFKFSGSILNLSSDDIKIFKRELVFLISTAALVSIGTRVRGSVTLSVECRGLWSKTKVAQMDGGRI